MLMIMIKLLNVTFVTIGFTLIAITLNYIAYKFLQNFKDPWYCILCCSQIFPFNSPKINKDFSMCVSNFHNNDKPVKTLNNESSLLLKSSVNQKPLVNQINNGSPEVHTDTANVV